MKKEGCKSFKKLIIVKAPGLALTQSPVMSIGQDDILTQKKIPGGTIFKEI